MTYVSLLLVGTTLDQVAEAMDPILVEPKDKRHARFDVLEEDIRKAYDTWEGRSNQPWNMGQTVPLRELYDNDFDKFVAAEFEGVEKNAEGLLGRWTNPNARFSYYVIGGRNSGFFQLCKGGIGHLEKRFSRFDPLPDPNTADSTTFRYWDRELQAKIQYDRAVERHRYFYSKLGDIKLPVSAEDWPKLFTKDSPLHGYELTPLYTLTEKEYATQSAMRANVTYAVLKDGVVYERQFDGRAGAPGECEEFYQWHRTFMGLMEGLDPSTPLVAVTAYL